MAKETKKAPASSGVKETIYIDVDDEITHIIDKVKASKKKIIALVLPKRANVLQSIVNMKLLKKAAVNSKKSIVLITSETGLLPLAGAAGIHVAKTLQSKPVIPAAPTAAAEDNEAEDITEDTLDKNSSIGSLAAASAASSSKSQDPFDDTETIEFDNLKIDDEPAVPIKGGKRGTGKPGGKSGKSRKLKVPNFDKFRTGIGLAVLAGIVLIAGLILAFIVLPKATIALKTDTTSVVSSFDFTADTSITELDAEAKKIPAVLQETKKTDTEKVAATGQRDDGTRATGEVRLSVPCFGVSSIVTVPAGTTVTTGDLRFVTQETARLNSSSGGGPSSCVFYDEVDVISSENGDKYNIGRDKTFSVSGFSSVTGKNDDNFSGGTSKIVKIVSQQDVDNAVEKINSRVGESVGDELSSRLESDKLYALKETLTKPDPKITISPEVGQEASEVTVTSESTYSMLGVHKDDLKKAIEDDIKEEVDLEKQSVIDDGIDASIMRINNNTNPGQAFISFRTSVTVGPEIDEAAIKEAVRGKKRGEVESYANGITGVKGVEVNYSPFWVYSTPKAAKKINIVIEKLNEQSTESGNDGDR